jgi:hypothetical protein
VSVPNEGSNSAGQSRGRDSRHAQEFARHLPLPDLPDVDLLWRTGAEQRTSTSSPGTPRTPNCSSPPASGQTSTAATCGTPSPSTRDGDAVTARPPADLSSTPGGVGPDLCRTPPPAAAVHPPAVPRDRRADVPVRQHDQVGGVLDLPQAGRLLTQSGGRPVPQPRPSAHLVSPQSSLFILMGGCHPSSTPGGIDGAGKQRYRSQAGVIPA